MFVQAGKSDQQLYSTNIWNKVYLFQEALFCQKDFSPQYVNFYSLLAQALD